MQTCFVIQPFDGGAFDKRFEAIIKPAIEAAGLTAYRVDRDTSTVIPIETIEKEIRRAKLCLADISKDNPNVWYELGFEMSASRKHVEMICTTERERFPFDVQHRFITRYRPESPQDFDKLKENITARLQSALKREEELEDISQLSPVTLTAGLSPQEFTALVIIAQNLSHPHDQQSYYNIRNEMANAGYTPIAITLALRSLERKGLVEGETVQENYDEGYAYRPTEAGFTWLENNESSLVLREPPPPPASPPAIDAMPSDEVPF